jgi:hypothetical protein
VPEEKECPRQATVEQREAHMTLHHTQGGILCNFLSSSLTISTEKCPLACWTGKAHEIGLAMCTPYIPPSCHTRTAQTAVCEDVCFSPSFLITRCRHTCHQCRSSPGTLPPIPEGQAVDQEAEGKQALLARLMAIFNAESLPQASA